MAGKAGASGGHNRTHTPRPPQQPEPAGLRPTIGAATPRGRPQPWTAWCAGQTIDMLHRALLRHFRASGQPDLPADVVAYLAERYWTRNLAAHLLADWRAKIAANPVLYAEETYLEPRWPGSKRTLTDVQRQASLDLNTAWRQIERTARQVAAVKPQAPAAVVSPLDKFRRAHGNRATGK